MQDAQAAAVEVCVMTNEEGEEEYTPTSLDKAVSKFDWHACMRLVDITKQVGLRAIVESLRRSDTLVSKYPNERFKKKLANFIGALTSAIESSDSRDLIQNLDTIVRQASLLELCFHKLLATLLETPAGKLSPAAHAWSLIESLSLQVVKIKKRTLDFSDVDDVGFDPMTRTIKDDFGNRVRPDDYLGGLSRVTASSLVMIATQMNGLLKITA